MTLRLATLALIVFSLAACQKSVNEQRTVEIPPAPTPLPDELLGQWKSNCVEGQNLALTAKSTIGITQSSVITIDEKTVTELASISSRKCEDRDIEITSISTLARRPLSTASDRKEISLSGASYKIKPVSEFGVRVLNIAKWCGIDDWTLAQERDVSAQIGKDKCVSSARAIDTVYAVSGANLYFGNLNGHETQPSSAEKSMELRKDFYFTRL